MHYRCSKSYHTNASAVAARWSHTLTSQTCKSSSSLSLIFVAHSCYSPLSDWHLIAKHAVPVPADWLPIQESLYSSFDVGPIIPGEPYDKNGNKDPYPEFCWTSERIRKGIVNMEAVEVDVEAVYGEYAEKTVEKADVQPQNKRCARFVKRLVQKIKTLGHRTRRRTPPTQSVSFFSLPPTPILSSCSSYSLS